LNNKVIINGIADLIDNMVLVDGKRAFLVLKVVIAVEHEEYLSDSRIRETSLF